MQTEAGSVSVTLPNTHSIAVQATGTNLEAGRHTGHRLDEQSCPLSFAPFDLTQWQEVAFDSSLRLGFRISSADCPECSPAEPIRIDSLQLLMRRTDGSRADTLDILVSLYCPLNPSDACQGGGVLRGTVPLEIAFSFDLLDGLDESRIVTIPINMLADSIGAFLVVESLGFRANQPAPRVGHAIQGAYPVQNCGVWIGHGSMQTWDEYFAPQFPGAPQAFIAFSCGLPDTLIIPPCAIGCEFLKFDGEPVFFDPSTNVVYQWVDENSLEFPVSPLSANLKLFFEQLGSASDSAYFRVVFACPSFGERCCPPAAILHESAFVVARGTDLQTVLDIQARLADNSFSLTEPFWFGVVLDSVTGQSTLPSFLFSAAALDVTPPQACEQWCRISGTLNSYRQDGLGWVDISFTGYCSSLAGQPVDVCTISPSNLNCSAAIEIACREDGITLLTQQIEEGIGSTDRYCCSDHEHLGHELIFRIVVPEQGNLGVRLNHSDPNPLALFLLSSCDPRNCIAASADSLLVTGLAGQEYFLIVESSDTLAHELEIIVRCYGDCVGETRIGDVRGPGGTGNRYLDGEGDGAGNTIFYSYYPGAGTSQIILKYDAVTCDSLPPVIWESLENSPSRMLAYDPRNGGEFWCGTTIDYFAGSGRLYRISSGGGVVQSWTWLTGLPIKRWSGAAFDAQHNHLWVFIRDSLNTGNSRAYELDLTDPQQPVVIQGPHLLPHNSPNFSQSCAGADYADSTNRLLIIHQGLPDDFVQCYDDLDAGYAGPRPGPGLIPTEWCAPDSNSVQGFGLAAIDRMGSGEIAMLNFTDADWVHPLMRYPAPCRLVPFRCVPPDDLCIQRENEQYQLFWTALESGVYEIYSTLSPNNDGNPDGGLDSLFHLEISLTLEAGPAQWADADSVATFKTYSIILNCPSGVVQNSQFRHH